MAYHKELFAYVWDIIFFFFLLLRIHDFLMSNHVIELVLDYQNSKHMIIPKVLFQSYSFSGGRAELPPSEPIVKRLLFCIPNFCHI